LTVSPTYTEAEASQKLCPFIRAWGYYDETAPPGSPPMYEHIKCRASDCMAWRWLTPAPDAKRGYCGMSGER
jgi:hypothetical protein